ncbi:hypothetical protein INR49_015488 [Caranx melampygus]|nr:hypothetical protein INR49_015488 [Caranx melampygus]
MREKEGMAGNQKEKKGETREESSRKKPERRKCTRAIERGSLREHWRERGREQGERERERESCAAVASHSRRLRTAGRSPPHSTTEGSGHVNAGQTPTTSAMAQAAKHLRKNKDLEAQAEQERKEKEEERVKKRSRSRDKKRKVLGPFTAVLAADHSPSDVLKVKIRDTWVPKQQLTVQDCAANMAAREQCNAHSFTSSSTSPPSCGHSPIHPFLPAASLQSLSEGEYIAELEAHLSRLTAQHDAVSELTVGSKVIPETRTCPEGSQRREGRKMGANVLPKILYDIDDKGGFQRNGLSSLSVSVRCPEAPRGSHRLHGKWLRTLISTSLPPLPRSAPPPTTLPPPRPPPFTPLSLSSLARYCRSICQPQTIDTRSSSITISVALPSDHHCMCDTLASCRIGGWREGLDKQDGMGKGGAGLFLLLKSAVALCQLQINL